MLPIKLLRSIAASFAALSGGGDITIQIPILKSQAEVDSFVKEHGRVLLGYTARRSSQPRAYDPWQEAVGKLFTEMYQDPNNRSDRPKLAIAEVVQSGTGQEESETKQLSINKGDRFMTLVLFEEQICGVTHFGSGWVHAQGDQMMMKPAFGIPCPELPNSLVLQFQDSSDSEESSQRRQKKLFLHPTPKTILVSNVGALHIQVNETTWSKSPSLDVTLERISRQQKESDIGVLVERIPDVLPSTILQYERKMDDSEVTFPLESSQQIEELYSAIVQREQDGVFDEDDDNGDSLE